MKNIDKLIKQNILISLRETCMKNHLCGNYIHINDQDIEWDINLDKLGLIAFTDYGTYFYEYNFEFDFDCNLQAFYEELLQFLEVANVSY